MNQYLLTYHKGEQFLAEVVDARGIADIIGRSLVTGARGFKAYLITPDGLCPTRLSGCINSMVVNVSDAGGAPMESAMFFGR